MEAEQREQFIGQLYSRIQFRGISSQFGVGWKQEALDTEGIVEVLDDVYMDLAAGLHEDIKKWHADRHPLLELISSEDSDTDIKVLKSLQSAISFRLNTRDDEAPEYLQIYNRTRQGAYEELLQQAINNSDYGILFSTINVLQESTMARQLLGELNRERMKRPDAIAGDVRRVLNFINAHNFRIDAVRSSLEKYAINEAKREKSYESRRILNDLKTGFLGAVAIGIRFKLGNRVSKRKAMKEYVYNPLERIAKLPSVPEQIIHKEEEMYKI